MNKDTFVADSKDKNTKLFVVDFQALNSICGSLYVSTVGMTQTHSTSTSSKVAFLGRNGCNVHPLKVFTNKFKFEEHKKNNIG